MTTPAEPPMEIPVFDTGNPYTGAEVPAVLVTDTVTGPGGQRLALTLRIPNTTVTVLLTKDDALKWADQIREEVSRMNGLILPPARRAS